MKSSPDGLLIAGFILAFIVAFLVVLPSYLKWVVVFPALEMLLVLMTMRDKEEGSRSP